MPLNSWTARRRALKNAKTDDLFDYDDIPQELRVQIVHILRASLGGYMPENPYYHFQHYPASNGAWDSIEQALAKEFGQFSLGTNRNGLQDFSDYFLATTDIDHLLDSIQLAFRMVDIGVRQWGRTDREESRITQHPDDAIRELNERLLSYRVGYQFVSGEIVKVDNELIHADVILPALRLLSDPTFAGANQEFLTAHDHLRHGRTKEAIGEANKAFESTMKVICDIRGWPYTPNDAASKLVDNVFTNGLVPAHLQSQFTALRSVLSSGVATVRNKQASHGQGSVPTTVPDYVARFAVHSAASNIVLLVEAHQAMP